MTLLIGQTHTTSSSPIGFSAPGPTGVDPAPFDIVDKSDAGLVTIAGTGAGKGVSQVIPNLLAYPGSAVVIDIKGEIAAVTARRRREMGQDVYIIDPFSSADTDFIDPFDLVQQRHPSAVDDCRMLAQLLGGSTRMTADPFWEDRARDLVTGTLLFIAEHVPSHVRSLPLVQSFWTSSLRKMASGLALMQESPLHDGILGRYAQQFIDPPEKTRSSILTSIQNMVECLSSPAAQRGFGMGARGRKVDLAALKEGRPMTIYLTVPPAYLSSHASLLRLWLGTALTAVQRREVIPAQPTLFMVDEAAQLGRLDALLTAATLMRGYGLRVWSFWQSIAQMERIYGPALQEFLDNAGTVSMFGIANGASAARAAQLTGWTGELMGLPRNAQVIAQAGSAPQIARRVDYRKDTRFRGMFDPNPFHQARQVIREVA